MNHDQKRRWRFLRKERKNQVIDRALAEVMAISEADRKVSLDIFTVWKTDALDPQHGGTLRISTQAMAERISYKRRRTQHGYDVLGAGSVTDRPRSRPVTEGHNILVISTRRGGVAKTRWAKGRCEVEAMNANEISLHPRFLPPLPEGAHLGEPVESGQRSSKVSQEVPETLPEARGPT